jgi:hypothetical protein
MAFTISRQPAQLNMGARINSENKLFNVGQRRKKRAATQCLSKLLCCGVSCLVSDGKNITACNRQLVKDQRAQHSTSLNFQRKVC